MDETATTPETQNSPEAEITLNPEAVRVQYQSQAQAVLAAAVEFIRRQGSSTGVIVDVLAYKALREEVHGFNAVSYELMLQTMLSKAQKPSAEPAPDSADQEAETPRDDLPSEAPVE